jgi:hypothetical protein
VRFGAEIRAYAFFLRDLNGPLRPTNCNYRMREEKGIMGGDAQLKIHVGDEMNWQPDVDEAAIGAA